MTVVPLQHRFDGPRHAPTVLLVPEFGTKWSMWEPQMPELTRTNRILRINHRGHGTSPAPEGPYTVAELVEDILALLERLGLERLSIVGFGLGGMLATWLASTAPDRVNRLALVAATARTPPVHRWRDIGSRARKDGMAAVSAEVTTSWFTPPWADERPDIVARMVEEFEAVEAAGYAGCCDAVADQDQRGSLARVRAPAVVLSAAHDPLLPPGHGRRLANGISGARFEVVPGAAHMVGIERSDRVNELLMGHVAR
ncbi:3-oxoadipate enol-lactonase [Lipingzhangella halophila]|uniref:3-oxoadipate enol-lactonase n=1 Tax=Lipingzhangella halophila TaxID=1783352 RepID=A0A7W7RLQ4_9ACTN|nr:alpha/beta fold hydrolase [Lipingzhangella halophila]MBB4934294.1 3-oxoadipate enol-lactonase [Lipingzhangella halophila]